MAATGHPAPFGLGAPAYLIALGGWLAATVLLLVSADDLVRLAISSSEPLGAAHAIGLVFFPFAVAAAVWQLLPVMLRNDPPAATAALGRPRASSSPGSRSPSRSAPATARSAQSSAVLLGVGLALLLAEVALAHPRGADRTADRRVEAGAGVGDGECRARVRARCGRIRRRWPRAARDPVRAAAPRPRLARARRLADGDDPRRRADARPDARDGCRRSRRGECRGRSSLSWRGSGRWRSESPARSTCS